MRTSDELDRETNALIKLILSDMEELAAMAPAEAAHPYELEQRRTRVIRRIWRLTRDYKEAVAEAAHGDARPV